MLNLCRRERGGSFTVVLYSLRQSYEYLSVLYEKQMRSRFNTEPVVVVVLLSMS